MLRVAQTAAQRPSAAMLDPFSLGSVRKWSSEPLLKQENRVVARFREPSAGLEPATPSLPWQSGDARGHPAQSQSPCTGRAKPHRQAPAPIRIVRHPPVPREYLQFAGAAAFLAVHGAVLGAVGRTPVRRRSRMRRSPPIARSALAAHSLRRGRRCWLRGSLRRPVAARRWRGASGSPPGCEICIGSHGACSKTCPWRPPARGWPAAQMVVSAPSSGLCAAKPARAMRSLSGPAAFLVRGVST